jgi:hypothetical protein
VWARSTGPQCSLHLRQKPRCSPVGCNVTASPLAHCRSGLDGTPIGRLLLSVFTISHACTNHTPCTRSASDTPCQVMPKPGRYQQAGRLVTGSRRRETLKPSGVGRLSTTAETPCGAPAPADRRACSRLLASQPPLVAGRCPCRGSSFPRERGESRGTTSRLLMDGLQRQRTLVVAFELERTCGDTCDPSPKPRWR